MELENRVIEILNGHSENGWKELFELHGFNINSNDLKSEFKKDLQIDRAINGFEDFHSEANKAFEPGNPSKSLVYHAFASPNVISNSDIAITSFCSMKELDILENYIYSLKKVSLESIKHTWRNHELAVVVFANEYRPASETTHYKYADTCFSRTGITRVGNLPNDYNSKLRGFYPTIEDKADSIKVIPCKFTPYVSVKVKGDTSLIDIQRERDEDTSKWFWLPIHKLFDGEECLKGLDLEISFSEKHVNEKLKRIHNYLNTNDYSRSDLNNYPFYFEKGLVEFNYDKDLYPNGILFPKANPIVKKALFNGEIATFSVPKGDNDDPRFLTGTFSSSINIKSLEGYKYRKAPEYVHARTVVDQEGNETDLNDIYDFDSDGSQIELEKIILEGNYKAAHYIDYTCDGWVRVKIAALKAELPNFIDAYSLVTAPDYFPDADQRELMDWYENTLSENHKKVLWWVEPKTLADDRNAPNIELTDHKFDSSTFETYTSIVSNGSESLTSSPVSKPTKRSSSLPDSAAGEFAPGWDVSLDNNKGIDHLAAYGLGSPFPEDSKLCAALSSFWPAVAPDVTRTFEPGRYPTMSPLTDDEIGMGENLPWDGVKGPIMKINEGYVDYNSIERTDYVQNVLKNKFDYNKMSEIDITEYKRRIIAQLKAYELVGAFNDLPNSNPLEWNGINRREKLQWAVYSFKKVKNDHEELLDAQSIVNKKFSGRDIYRIVIFKHGEQTYLPNTPKIRVKIDLDELYTIFTDLEDTISRKQNEEWKLKENFLIV